MLFWKTMAIIWTCLAVLKYLLDVFREDGIK